ncbi:hypothetical protein FOL47_002691, partial [Perkinsus chesapeaki]
ISPPELESGALDHSAKLAQKDLQNAVGFEPTRISPPELESGALDHSAKLTQKDLQNAVGFEPTRISPPELESRVVGSNPIVRENYSDLISQWEKGNFETAKRSGLLPQAAEATSLGFQESSTAQDQERPYEETNLASSRFRLRMVRPERIRNYKKNWAPLDSKPQLAISNKENCPSVGNDRQGSQGQPAINKYDPEQVWRIEPKTLKELNQILGRHSNGDSTNPGLYYFLAPIEEVALNFPPKELAEGL